MDNLKVYILQGDPIPLLRARYSSRTGTIYNSQKTRQIVDQINLQQQHFGKPFFEGPLYVDIVFYMPIPKNISLNKKQKISGSYHLVRSDIDNLTKYIFDVAQSVLFKNDCSISKITAQKIYDENPRTEFTITVLA